MWAKLFAIGAVLVSFVMALIGYGKQKQKTKDTARRLTAAQAAIEADQEAQRQYNEGIEKDNADIRNDTYYK